MGDGCLTDCPRGGGGGLCRRRRRRRPAWEQPCVHHTTTHILPPPSARTSRMMSTEPFDAASMSAVMPLPASTCANSARRCAPGDEARRTCCMTACDGRRSEVAWQRRGTGVDVLRLHVGLLQGQSHSVTRQSADAAGGRSGCSSATQRGAAQRRAAQRRDEAQHENGRALLAALLDRTHRRLRRFSYHTYTHLHLQKRPARDGFVQPLWYRGRLPHLARLLSRSLLLKRCCIYEKLHVEMIVCSMDRSIAYSMYGAVHFVLRRFFLRTRANARRARRCNRSEAARGAAARGQGKLPSLTNACIMPPSAAVPPCGHIANGFSCGARWWHSCTLAASCAKPAACLPRTPPRARRRRRAPASTAPAGRSPHGASSKDACDSGGEGVLAAAAQAS